MPVLTAASHALPHALINTQDLWLHQQDSTWGRLLLSGVPQGEWADELEKLAETAEAIQSNARQAAYKHVQQVPQQEVEAAAATAAAGSSERRLSCHRQHSSSGGGGAAAAAGARQVPPQQQQNLQLLSWLAAIEELEGQQQHASGSSSSGSSNGGGSSSLWQPPQYQHQQQQQPKQQAAQQAQALARHMVDKQLLSWFSSPELTQTTGEWRRREETGLRGGLWG